MMTREASTVEAARETSDDDGNGDQLSRLPDPVILDILSLLPTRDLVKTVLIPSFRSLWPYVRDIDFDYYVSEIGDRLGNLIRSVLMVHELPTIHGFKIRFPFHTPYEFLPPHVQLVLYGSKNIREAFARHMKIRNELDVCVAFAVRKQVQVFEMDLGYRCKLMCEPDIHYTLSSALFRLASLTELKLGCCDIDPGLGGKICLDSLKILSLKRVALSENIMDEILLWCPLLENLSLLEWFGLNKLNIMNPKTKSLTLHHESLEAQLQIFCPHVLALKIHLLGHIEDLEIIDVSSVEDADLRLHNTASDDIPHVVVMLPEKLRHAKAMKLCHFTSKGLIDSDFTMLPFLLFNWRLLRLNLMDWHPSGLCKLLERCPHLETLTLRIGNDFLDASCWKWSRDDGCWKWSHDLAVEIPWHASDVSFHCLEHSLKKISVVIFSNVPAVFELLKLLLNKAAVLEKMVLSLGMQACRSIGRHELMELIQQFLSLNKASPRAVIRFSPAY